MTGVTRFLPAPVFGAELAAVLDASACATLIDELGVRGFQATATAYPRGYRDNDRIVFDDAPLAARLFARVHAALPYELDHEGERWRLVGLNTRFRACRYRGGQAFCIHRDGPYVPTTSTRSLLTLQIYLDDASVMTGGHTRFYADRDGLETWASIAPTRGTAIVFDHRVWHDGEAVTAGAKHVIRTDVMYARATGPAELARGEIGAHRGYAWRVIDGGDGTLVTSGRDGVVRRWRSTLIGEHDLGGGSVTALARAHDGRLWCGTRAGQIVVIAGDVELRHAGRDAILALTARSGGGVAAATARGELLELEHANGHATRTTHAHDGWAWAVLAEGRDALLSCGDDGQVVRTEAGRPTTIAAYGRPLRALAQLPSGTLVVGGGDGTLHLLGDRRASWRGHAAAITSLAVAPDGTFASSSEDGRIAHWREDQLLATTTTRPDFVTCVAFAAIPGSEPQLVATGYDGLLWRVAFEDPAG
ncbi:MAG: 2OG-Fe(II) oxygenase [Proteobacteria bacterium]|nr:2OG-Fe(II) oxygenase [Pseudomonadota bacterium]